MRGIVFERYRPALPRSLPVLLLICLSTPSVSSGAPFNESSSEPLLRKCCPPQEIFLGRQNILCIPAPSRAMELHSMSHGARLRTHNIPNCADPEDIRTMSVDLITAEDRFASPICLDVLRSESTSRELPVVAYCASNETTSVQKVDKSTLPRIVTVRRCCPRDMLYDPRYKSCVSVIPEVEDISFAPLEDPFLSLLPKTDSIDFLALTRGPPICNRSLFDYRIAASDLSFGDRALKAKLSLSQGERKEEFELTEENACIELTPESTVILRLCREEEACLGKPCVAKCCSEDQFFVPKKGCQKFDGPITPIEFHAKFRNVTVHKDFFREDYGLLVGNPCKFGMYHVEPEVPWSITPDGHLQLDSSEIYEHRGHCIDMYYNVTEFAASLIAFVCFDAMDTSSECELRCTIQLILQSISCVFFLITLVVYACLPALQNLHGKTLMCHVASLLLAYVCLVLISVLTPKLSEEEPLALVSCAFLGYTMLFSFLSAFAWLNVMCFDIWWTFGGLRENMSTRGRGHRKRFLLYSLYAWGLASTITIIAILADETKFIPIYLQPGIGRGSCWFTQAKNLHSEVLFFIGPVTLQTVINIILFVMTIIHCNKVKAEINRVTADPSDARNKRFRANRTKLVMNIKLFIVMGVSWIMESVSYFLNNYAKELKWREEFFYASDAFNCLQGLLIFILFVLKSRVYHALRRRLGFESKKQGSSNATTVNDPCRMKKSVSNSTLMSTFQVSSTP
ncbi:hypothetical protein KPH14_002957 [Odynerus spinipes]|uniref:G-protein coupled receptors family 2 profile 2 domain-containing protein n=1 Tax=Odynerus spinipes TaxID=1348599 RepID=A0AAD9RWI1_9HYME|nr:hypothetical protein KPH14_002957 [Odynerus spinipes]